MKKIVFSNPIKSEISRLKEGNQLFFIIFCFLLFVGIICGAVSGRNADIELLKKLDFIFRTNYDIRCSQGILSAFVSSFASSVIFLGVIFLLGLSLWGGFFSAVIPFLKGYGYGLSVGFLYNAYGFYGVGYNLLVVLPGAFVSAIVLSAASQESLKNTVKLISCFMGTAIKDNPRRQMREYFASMLWFLLLCAGASVLDMVFSLCFSWIFKF